MADRVPLEDILAEVAMS